MPHSAENQASPGINQETVKFQDMVPGHTSMEPGVYDGLRSEGMDSDLSLQKFFERPVLITDVAWTTGGVALFHDFDPWTLFFTNKRVINRLSNFKLLQAKLHVKAVLNGTPFNFGSAIMSYRPLSLADDLTRNRALFVSDIVAASQRPHVFLDPANNAGGTITCPFVHPQNALDIVDADWTEMGDMNIREIAPLKHCTGTVNNVTISVYAWATDVNLAVPTQYNAGDIVPQSDEYSRPAFSTHATALASFARNLVSAPVIGPYMRATQIAASSAAHIASMFGYCKPVDLELTQIRKFTTGQLAITNGKDDSRKLSVDAKQELTLDPRAFGLTNTDELDIGYLTQRESWFYNFSWSMGYAPETLLFNTIVDPLIFRTESVPGGFTEIHMTALAFASLPFSYWRGSLIYRFQVICSKFHRGRLRIVYDPTGGAGNLTPSQAEYNTAYNTIVDISETTDFEIKVGWGQATSYRSHVDLTDPTTNIYGQGPSALTYESLSFGAGNGVLSVYVVNDLVAPDTTVDNDISVNVFIKAADDFEVAAPTSQYVNRLRFRPQSEELAIHNLPSAAPSSAPLIDTYATDNDLTGPANLIHFGESIRSFRPLLKRFTVHEYSVHPDVAQTNVSLVRIERPAMPFEPGWAPLADATSTVPQLIGAAYYAYANMTLLKYVSSAFVGWRGSIRWKIHTGSCCNWVAGPTMVSRYTGCKPLNQVNSAPALVRRDDYGDFYDNTNGFEGVLLENPAINPVVSFEVPYYTQFRFAPARELTDFTSIGGFDWVPCWKYRSAWRQLSDASLPQTMTLCAAGEDFNVGFFVGAPVVFLETTIPP